jgi:hypothetical protein
VLHGTAPPGAYPALVSVLIAPITVLPRDAADVVVSILLVACTVGILRALDVTDWRCYGATLLWLPVFSAVQVANVVIPLTLGTALLWRWRDRRVASGLTCALVIALKLFLWPLAVWLAATRRWRAVGLTVSLGLLASLAAWSVVGFAALGHFPTFLHKMIELDGGRSYTISAFLRDLGTPAAAAYAVSTAIGLGILAAAVVAARRGLERQSFGLAIGAALALSPIVWTDYPVLLLVPVAIARPRFSWLWLAPLPMWVCPHVDGAAWQKAVLLLAGAVTLTLATRSAPRSPAPAGSVADAAALREGRGREVRRAVAREAAVA